MLVTMHQTNKTVEQWRSKWGAWGSGPCVALYGRRQVAD